LDLERDLPGRWQGESSQQFMDVQSDLSSVWGDLVEGIDEVSGRSTWSLDAEGLVQEAGAGPCTDGVSCTTRFVRAGTAAVDAEALMFYALWPLEECPEGMAGVFEGRERFSTNAGTEQEPRIWSQYHERLSLESNGRWHWSLEVKSYGSFSDMGQRTWYPQPEVVESEDSGTYEVTDNSLRFWTDVDDAIPGWVYISSPAEEPVELPFIGRALPRSDVMPYRRVER
jgi:hypothetical protein